MKKVLDFMNKDVIYFKPDDTIFDAAKVFSEKNISGAPVVENEKVVGVVSESDIVNFMSMKFGKKPSVLPSISLIIFSFIKEQTKFKDEIERISKTKIKDIMSKEIVCAHPEMNLLDAASLMKKKDVNRLPVIDKGKLVGIIARADLIRALIE